MGIITQIIAVTSMNFRSLPQRVGTSLVVVAGVAAGVAVLATVLAMSAGLTDTAVEAGRPDRVIVLRTGAQYEAASSLRADAIQQIVAAPGIRQGASGSPAASAESVTSVNLPKRGGVRVQVGVRGVPANFLEVRPEIKLVAGRMFRPGVRELIVGRAAQAQFQGLALGANVNLHGTQWTIVGAFTSNGDAHESELLTDVDTLPAAQGPSVRSSVTVLLESAAALGTFKNALSSLPGVSLQIMPEAEYYSSQSKTISVLLFFVTRVVGTIMAIGALCGALNTMYAAVSARTMEIATLRAIGFKSGGVIVSVLAEALLLSIIGAALGIAIAYLGFNGSALSTMGGVSIAPAQIVYKLNIGVGVVVAVLVWACAVGLLGGLFPALRAARLPVASALRAT